MRAIFVVNYVTARATHPHAGIFVERQAESLRDLGVTIEIFDLGPGHSPLHLLRKWRELRRRIRDWRPDVLHAQYGTVVALVSVLTGHRTVITFSGSDLLPGASISRLRTWLGIFISNVAALGARHVICVSDELRRALWWRRRDVTVVTRGVDVELFSPGPRDEARARLGWDANTPVALFAGTGDAQNKGLPLAQAAVGLARASVPDLELRVIRQVPPDRMPLYYRAADVLVFTSRQEGSPNAVKEALACALPVVSVRVGDVEERLDGVEPSVVVERTPDAVAAGLVTILREGRRSNGPAKVAPLALDRIAARILEVYARLSHDHAAEARAAVTADHE